MRILMIICTFASLSAFSQVGIGTENPEAMLDVNGTMRISDIPTDLASNYFLVVGENNIISQNMMPTFFAISGMEIPVCRYNYVGDTDNFILNVNGSTYNVTSTILVLSQGTTVYSTGNPIRAQRMQVRYDFSPALPFNPDGFSLTGYNTGGTTETFSLNYAAKSASSITINITRTDQTSRGAETSYNDCWDNTFYFDMTLYNYN